MILKMPSVDRLLVAVVATLCIVQSVSTVPSPALEDGYYNDGGKSVEGDGPPIHEKSSQQDKPGIDYTTDGYYNQEEFIEIYGPIKELIRNPDTRNPWSNFATIGMPFPKGQSSVMVIPDVKDVRQVEVNDNSYYVLYESKKSGIQLWEEKVRSNDPTSDQFFGFGFEPHFRGKSLVKVCVLAKEDDPFDHPEAWRTIDENIPLKGSFRAVYDPTPAVSGLLDFTTDQLFQQGRTELQFMFVESPDKEDVNIAAGMGFVNPDTNDKFVTFHFDCPNYGFFSREPLSLPTHLTIQLSAFAREISTYESVTDYHENRKFVCLASKFFAADQFLESVKTRKTFATFVGHVVETEMKTNELTGQSFYWALIETVGDMEMDVVIHPALLEAEDAKPPQAGGVLMGYGWLSGLWTLEEEGEEDLVKNPRVLVM